jgi:crossover junction endodeoxyribonuclease RuvC
MLALGIDPGLERTGYGYVAWKGEPRHITHGTIVTPRRFTPAARLAYLYRRFKKLLARRTPDQAIVEEIFFTRNVRTAIAVAEARGVILLALAEAGVPCITLTPNEVKRGLTGYGKADKAQVRRMVQKILRLARCPQSDDAADALAMALSVPQNALVLKKAR